jgi:septum formation protein
MLSSCYSLGNMSDMVQQARAQQHATSPLVLASVSPRRRELLRYLTPAFEAIATEGETIERALIPEVVAQLPPFELALRDHPTFIAWRKAIAAVEAGVRGLILAADTIVVIDGEVLGKPRDAAHAEAMLARLVGRTHTVYTGVVTLRHLPDEQPTLQMALDAAKVRMAPVEAAEIAAYVATGEPLDKAGSYGIQGLGGRLVQQVNGSYTCVVGLPLVTTHKLLTMMGVVGLVDPVVAFERWLADQGRASPPCTVP